MTAISQRIPNFSHGISQQPDYLKRPGQVREAVNCLPDVTEGLLKRPGGRRVHNLGTTSGGKWFTIYRDDYEQYLVQYKDGLFKIWSLLDGLPVTVHYTDIPDSSYGTGDDSIIDTGPGILGCDPKKLTLAFRELKIAKQDLDAKEDEIAKLIEAASAPGKTVTVGSFKEDHEPYVIVTQGYVIVKYDYEGYKKGQVLEFGRPDPGPGETVTVGDLVGANKRMLLTGYLPSAPVGGSGGGIFGPRSGGPFMYDWIPVDVYNYKVVTPGPTVDESALATLRAERDALFAVYEQKKELAEIQAAACGITDLPVSRFSSITTPDYLVGATADDIEVLTVNDYTFVTNRKRRVAMGTDKSGLRPYEAFIDITNISYGTEYRVDFAWSDDPSASTYNVVTKLTVSPSSWEDDADDTVKYTDTQIFDQLNGLRFQLETRGQQTPKNPSDAKAGYKSIYNTYITLMNGGTGYYEGDVFTVTMRGKDYVVRVDEVKTRTAYSSAGTGKVLSTQNTTSGTLSGHDLATALAEDIKKNTFGITTKVVGSGIYCYSGKAFTVSTGSDAYLRAFTDEVNDVSRLPLQCVDGYVVKVVNSGEIEDDYYMKFKGKEGNDGVGVWEETVKPGLEVVIEPSSMPHQLKRQVDGSFLFSPISWEMRLVGDDKSNPKPSFINQTINKMFFFRNRLGLLSDENVILSRAGDYFNYWNKTALTVQPSDPIDISASSTFPAVLTDVVPHMQGAILFSPTQQFYLTTDQDVLGPETAKLINLSTFRYSVHVEPFSLGTTVGFLNRTGKYSRFMEMVGISRDRPPELVEQSKIVQSLMPSTINLLAESRENDIVMFGTRKSNRVYGYRYFNDGEKRIQSAWFEWTLQGKLEHHAVVDDAYFTVTEHETINGPKLWLMRYDLQPARSSAFIKDETGLEYPVALDNYVVSNIGSGHYYNHLHQTYFFLPWNHDPNTRVVAFVLGDTKFQGRMMYAKIETDSIGTWCVLDGDWSRSRIALGLDYEMKVVIPHLYVSREDTTANRVTSDTRSSLTISRVKFNFGESGTFETTIKRRGRPDYTELWETRPSDYYDANTHSVAPERGLTVPIYDRNTNVLIELKSSHPTPATLFSMDWEGNYSPMYYKSV